MFRPSKKKALLDVLSGNDDDNCSCGGRTTSIGTSSRDSTISSYNGSNIDTDSSTNVVLGQVVMEPVPLPLPKPFASMRTSGRSFSMGDAIRSTSSSSLPPSLFTIPLQQQQNQQQRVVSSDGGVCTDVDDNDDNDKYGSHRSLAIKYGWFTETVPRPRSFSRTSSGNATGKNVSLGSSNSGSSNNNKNCNGMNQDAIMKNRFIMLISLLAFFRVGHTFSVYKHSLDEIVNEYQSRSLSSVSLASSSSSTSSYTGNNILDYYMNSNNNIFGISSYYYSNSATSGKKKKTIKPIVTYDALLEEYDIPSLSIPQADIAYEMKHEGFDPWMLEQEQPTDTNESTMQQRLDSIRTLYREQRQQRSRPPDAIRQQMMQDDWTVIETSSSRHIERVPVGNTTTISIDENVDYNWSDLCKKANLSTQSRIVITNALSVSVGAPLTLLLAKQCNVNNIMIVDAMFPNTKAHRMIAMDTFRMLYRNVATLQLTVPTNTAGLGKTGDSIPTQWLHKFQPTHIIHLEDMDYNILDSQRKWGGYMSSKGQQLYHIQNSLLPLQQMIEYCHHKETTNTINMLHVTLSSILSNPETVLTADDEYNNIEHLHQTMVTSDINAMMADYLYTIQKLTNAAAIHDSNVLQLHQLQLPNVYGPIMNGRLHERVQKQQIQENTSSSLYVDDAMMSILQALYLSQSEQRHIMTVDTTISGSTLSYRQEVTYAYDIEMNHPYGGIEQEYYIRSMNTNIPKNFDSKRYRNDISKINEVYGIYKAQLPCASSCVDSSYSVDNDSVSSQCDASIWDTIYAISQSVTKDCINVMYYINLDPSYEQANTESTTTTSSSSSSSLRDLCRIAFISSDNHKIIQDPKSDFVISPHGWTYIPITDASKITEVERSMIRIDPSPFFASSVEKAMYVESDDILSWSDDVVLTQILVHAEDYPLHTDTYYTTELRDGFDDLYRTIEHPPSNGRSITFMGNELSDEVKPSNPAQYIQSLSERGERMSYDVKGRHLNYYKQMNHYVQVDMNRPVEDSDGSSPFIWISRMYFVHNLQSREAHTFRCQWYDVHMYWGNENVIRDSEELSLAYMIAKQRLSGNIRNYPLYDDSTWYPQMNMYTGEQIYVDNDETIEAFVRFM